MTDEHHRSLLHLALSTYSPPQLPHAFAADVHRRARAARPQVIVEGGIAAAAALMLAAAAWIPGRLGPGPIGIDWPTAGEALASIVSVVRSALPVAGSASAPAANAEPAWLGWLAISLVLAGALQQIRPGRGW